MKLYDMVQFLDNNTYIEIYKNNELVEQCMITDGSKYNRFFDDKVLNVVAKGTYKMVIILSSK